MTEIKSQKSFRRKSVTPVGKQFTPVRNEITELISDLYVYIRLGVSETSHSLMELNAANPARRNPTSRNWIYTLFNVGDVQPISESLEQSVGTWFTQLKSHVDGGTIRYVIGQLERCPETGRLHIQLYAEYRNPVRRGQLQRLLGLPDGYGWADPRRGSREQAIAYCSKEETRVVGPYQYGSTDVGDAKRSFVDTAIDALKAGGIKRVVEECPGIYLRYTRGVEALAAKYARPSDEFSAKEVFVLYGPTGTGKTSWAYDNYPGLFRMPFTSEKAYWSDGYEEEETILFDEYGVASEEKLPWSFLLQLIDGRPVQYPKKHGFNWILAKRFIFTSNLPPIDWYPGKYYDAFERRITHIFEFTAYKAFTIRKPSSYTVEEIAQAPFLDDLYE